MLTYKINEPLTRRYEAYSFSYSVAAQNWLIHGPIQLKFAMMTLVPNDFVELSKEFFVNHPSLFIAPTAFIYWLFGIGEWQTRVAPIFFSLLSLILFWKLIARVFKTPWLTITSSFFYAFFPMSVFNGSLLTNDYLALFFILALFLAVITFEQERQKKYLFAIFVIIFLGGLSDWTFLFAAAGAWWYILLTKNYPQKKLLLPLIIGILAASLSLTLLQIWSIANMNPLKYLTALFWYRNVEVAAGLATIRNFLVARLNYDLMGFSEIGLILAFVGAIFYLKTNKKDKAKILFLTLLASPGLLTYLVFYSHSHIHQFYGLYIMPAIALLAGYGMSRLRNRWHIGSVILLFTASSLWYSFALLNHTDFSPDDFLLFKRVNAQMSTTPICDGGILAQFDLKSGRGQGGFGVPCLDSFYFLLRRPQSHQKNIQLFSIVQAFNTEGVWKDTRIISFSAALVMEIIKSIPPLKPKLKIMFANRDPRKDNANAEKNAQAFIDEYKLQSADCSTNFCLYKKNL